MTRGSTLAVPRERAPRRASNLTCLMSPRSVPGRSLPDRYRHSSPPAFDSSLVAAGCSRSPIEEERRDITMGLPRFGTMGHTSPPEHRRGLCKRDEEVYGEVPGSRPAFGLCGSMLVVAVDGQLGLQSVDWKDCTRPSSLHPLRVRPNEKQ